MSIDSNFLHRVAPLAVAGNGTEHVAPLLYSLARMVRPRRVLEVGVGYTTPFLLQALADNCADFARGVDGMQRKSLAYREELGAQRGDIAAELAARAQLRWEAGTPCLGLPEYYAAPYRPSLDAIDDFSSVDSSRSALREVVSALSLGEYLELHEGSFRGRSRQISPQHTPIDLAWFDCGGYAEYVDFLEEYWDLVNPRGGLLILHSTLNNPLLGHVVKDLKLRQSGRQFNDFELVSFLEPHKFRQNSLTIVRRTEQVRDDYLWPERLTDGLLGLLDR